MFSGVSEIFWKDLLETLLEFVSFDWRLQHNTVHARATQRLRTTVNMRGMPNFRLLSNTGREPEKKLF
jgi:hypothetical protein